MLVSYRIHEEQIKKVAQNMKALYNTRQAESGIQKTSGCTGTQINRIKHAASTDKQLRKSRDHDGSGAVFNNNREDRMISVDSTPALRCIRCSDRFPATDFLYTKKSGLCISCWETKVL